jgi:serine/threonine-protein kinase
LQSLFTTALGLDDAEREAFLSRECAEDPALLLQLRGLLAADAKLAGTTARPIALGLTQILASTAPGASLSGLKIGPFELREELGRGGMGLVYRAERVDGTVEQQVAIKFVRRELLDATTLKRFQLERQVLASLDHPNIARLLDANELEDGTPYYVMEYVGGAPITEHCAREKLGVRERVALIRTVCGAVAHAHRNLVVHRDIKPSNVHVSAAGVPKLLDFGIAKPLRAAHEATGTAERFFSPQYAAPEQLLGEPIGVGCDVYALGLLLFELLAGRAPFELEGLTAGQVERQVCEVPPPAPSTVASDASRSRALRGELDDVVLKCLRKSPTERYSSVEQLEADLGNYLEGRAVQARGGHAWYRVRKFVGRHRVSVAIASAAFLAIAAAAVVLARKNVELTRERDRAQYAVSILKDAFTSADPAKSAGADITAREILASAQKRLDESFEAQPELYASLGGTIAEVDLELGLASQAAEVAERATRAARAAKLDDRSLHHALIVEADAHTSADQYKEARALLDEAAKLAAGRTPEWIQAEAHLQCQAGDPSKAIEPLKAAIATLAKAAPNDLLATNLRWQLSRALRMSHRSPEGLTVIEETLAWQRAQLPVDHPLVLRTRTLYIDLLDIAGHHEEAVKEAEQVLAAIERNYGPDTAFAAAVHNSMGIALRALGRRPEAQEQYRKAYLTWRHALGQEHTKTLRAMYNLAAALSRDPDQATEAEALFRELVATSTRRLGPGDDLVVFFRLVFGKWLNKTDRPADALEVLADRALIAGLRVSSEGNREEYLAAIGTAAAATCTATASQPSRCNDAEELRRALEGMH